LKRALKRANEKLWTIEDRIREKEASRSFDQEFIELARSVYRNNDERGRLKRDINLLLNSELVEEKQYSAY
jgi:intein/homing endonuclease